MKILSTEIKLFAAAVIFYTRIPCPKIRFDLIDQHRSIKYFPLVGWLVGSVSAAVFAVSTLVFSNATSVILAMISTLLITGAFHEDGFADSCDGFGGGYTSEKILEIMKDSRIGAFGAIGLISILALKFSLLFEFANISNFRIVSVINIAVLMVSAHAMSRFAVIPIMTFLEYAKITGKSKDFTAKPRLTDILFSLLFAIAPSAFFLQYYCIIPFGILLTASCFAALYLKNKLGGYTGDCLGAVQQISEILFYATAVILFKFFI